jgi:thioredoxin-related protein
MIKIKYLHLILLLCIAQVVFAQGIEFRKVTFKEALAEAKAENKLVFMDCFTTWCGPCKMLSKNVFPQKEVGDYVNDNYVSIKMDMEKGEGLELAKNYQVKAFPTLLFMNADGEVLYKKVGYLEGEELIEIAKKAKDPSQLLPYLESQYQNGNRDIEFMANYIKTLSNAFQHEQIKAVSNEVLPTLTEEQYLTEDGFTILSKAGVTYKSEPYNFVMKHKDELYKITGDKMAVRRFMVSAINEYVNEFVKDGTLEELEEAIKNVKKEMNDPYIRMSEIFWIRDYYYTNGQLDKWISYIVEQAQLEINKDIRPLLVFGTSSTVLKDTIIKPSGSIYPKTIKLLEDLKSEKQEALQSGENGLFEMELRRIYLNLAKLYKSINEIPESKENLKAYFELSNEEERSYKEAVSLKTEIDSL